MEISPALCIVDHRDSMLPVVILVELHIQPLETSVSPSSLLPAPKGAGRMIADPVEMSEEDIILALVIDGPCRIGHAPPSRPVIPMGIVQLAYSQYRVMGINPDVQLCTLEQGFQVQESLQLRSLVHDILVQSVFMVAQEEIKLGLGKGIPHFSKLLSGVSEISEGFLLDYPSFGVPGDIIQIDNVSAQDYPSGFDGLENRKRLSVRSRILGREMNI